MLNHFVSNKTVGDTYSFPCNHNVSMWVVSSSVCKYMYMHLHTFNYNQLTIKTQTKHIHASILHTAAPFAAQNGWTWVIKDNAKESERSLD